MALQKTQTVLLPTLHIENTSLVCCHLYGFNTNCKIILIATTACGCTTQHKQVQLLSRHCTVIKILLFFNLKSDQGKSLSSRTSKPDLGYEQQSFIKTSERVTRPPSRFQLVDLFFFLVMIIIFNELLNQHRYFDISVHFGTSTKSAQIKLGLSWKPKSSSAFVTLGRRVTSFMVSNWSEVHRIGLTTDKSK